MLVIELHWELPEEIVGVHSFWHPGWRSPPDETYVTVGRTGPVALVPARVESRAPVILPLAVSGDAAS